MRGSHDSDGLQAASQVPEVIGDELPPTLLEVIRNPTITILRAKCMTPAQGASRARSIVSGLQRNYQDLLVECLFTKYCSTPGCHETPIVSCRKVSQGASRSRSIICGLQRGHREFLVAVRREGQFVGEMAAFASAAVRCASVRARGLVRAKIVPGELLRACVERVPEVGILITLMSTVIWSSVMQGQLSPMPMLIQMCTLSMTCT